jgi:GMP synthase (glutamine-hydrolysing)
MKVAVVDNGGQWTHREWRVLRDLGADARIVANTTPFETLDSDAIVLSGGAPRIGSEAALLGSTGDYLDKAAIPVLGICVGCQFIAMHFGATAGPADVPEYGKMELAIDDNDEIFSGLPKKFFAWESHNDEVKTPVPKELKILAHSDGCKVQAFKHLSKPFYGVQFHPEVEHTEHGYEIFKNFIALARK